METSAVRRRAPRRSTAGTPTLLAAEPILTVLDELRERVGDLVRLAPQSDATAALALYRDRLAAAVEQASRLDVFVRTRTAAVVLNKSESMVTHLCRTGALRAKRVGGTWLIDRGDLERLRTGEARSEIDTVSRHAPAGEGA